MCKLIGADNAVGELFYDFFIQFQVGDPDVGVSRCLIVIEGKGNWDRCFWTGFSVFNFPFSTDSLLLRGFRRGGPLARDPRF